MFVRYALAGLSIFLVSSAQGSAEPPKPTLKLKPEVSQKCLEILRSGMKSDEFWPSIHASEGLTLAGHGDEVIAYLEPKLPQEKDDQQRCGLARELVRAGKREYAQVMLDILAGDDDYGHVHAAESLYKVGEIGDGKAMRRAFQQTENLRLRLMSAAALGKKGHKKAMKVLRTAVNHSDPEVRRIAVWILGRVGDSQDIPAIKALIPDAQEELLKAYYQHSLAALGDEEGLAALKKNLAHEDGAVRTYAATFAGDAEALSLKDDLIVLLDDPHADARYRAAQSLLYLSRPDR